jgi:ribosome-binding factor A
MNRRTKPKPSGAAATQRQLKVGELLREALADALSRGHFRDPALNDIAITVTEVRVPPDLRHARAYVVPLGGSGGDALIEALNRAAGYLRHEVDRRVSLRVSPEFRFELDASFDEAARIDALIRKVAPAKDD